MNYEKLLDEATSNDVYVIENANFESSSDGLINKDVIGLNKNIKTTTKRACVLAEELGHYHTSHGNIIDMRQIINRKQERKARLWGYNRLIGLYGLIKAFEGGCSSKHEIADYLGVTEDYLEEAIKCYSEKYGEGKGIDNYYVMFEPRLKILKMI